MARRTAKAWLVLDQRSHVVTWDERLPVFWYRRRASSEILTHGYPVDAQVVRVTLSWDDDKPKRRRARRATK